MKVALRLKLLYLLLCALQLQAQGKYEGKVKQIDIINWSHTDYGFTDHPLIAMELQKRFIDIAIDYADKSAKHAPGERFTWTVESLDPLYRWWQESGEERRNLLVDAINRGQIDVNIMPFNIHPYLNETEIKQLVNWIPEKLISKLKPRIAIQNDVNGFPRSVAQQLADKGISWIWLGMNGRHPFPIPTMTRWKLSKDQEVWLWNGGSYWDGYDYFSEKNWRTNQCEANNLMYRWPRKGEIFATDEASIRKAHKVCINKLRELEAKGYVEHVLPITFSNQWRGDNDGPFWGIVEFVRTWNRMGLQPTLHLSTTTATMQKMIANLSVQPQTVQGEFGDWWAFGVSALPRELTAARTARYLLQGVRSEVLGKQSKQSEAQSSEINRDICTFYEHTFASMVASSQPYSLFNQGSIIECSRSAYRAYELAKWQLAQRVRSCLATSPEGIYVINTQKSPYSGWLEFDDVTIRSNQATGVQDIHSGKKYPFVHEGNKIRFWTDDLPPSSINHFRIITDKEYPMLPNSPLPDIKYDAAGWPISVRWSEMTYPLYQGDIGSLIACEITSGGWWSGNAIFKNHPSQGTEVIRKETPYSVRFTQKIQNARINNAIRFIEIYRKEPRIHVRTVYNRTLHQQHTPEVFYVKFPLPDIQRKIITCNGGSVFTPYKENIPNTCQTFYVADSWVAYEGNDGTRVWSSKTSPLLCLGKTEFHKRDNVPCPTSDNQLLSMVYNNCWTVNFPMEYSGDVICDYDLYWNPKKPSKEEIETVTDTYLVEPVITIIPAAKEDASYQKWINNKK